jgi:flagellar hook-associated protein 3 FlgL
MSYFRVSTANSYDATINRINQRSLELSQSQEKLSAGKRVLRATDDPVAATLAERESNRLQRVQADLRALERSRSALEQGEGAVSDAVGIMHRIKELVVQGGNTSLSNGDRASIVQELQGLRDQLINLANAKDSEGNALLGGLGVTNSMGKPFADIYGGSQPNGVQFQAVSGQAASTETGVPNRVDGNFAFMRNLTGNGVFTVQHDTGNLLVSNGGVYDTSALNSNVFPYDDQASTQGSYMFDVVDDGNVPPHLILEITRYDKNGTGNQPAGSVDLGEYTPGTSKQLNHLSVQVEGVQLTLNGHAAPGDRLTLAPSEPGDLFATVQRAIDALSATGGAGNPNPSSRLTQELDRVHQEMSTGLDRLLLVQGRLGELLRRSDVIDGQLQTRAMDHEKAHSDLTDLDMVKGISQFQSQQLGLQAALQSYGQIQKLSLFQYIA